MRVVIQRVSRARVTVDGRETGHIGSGLLAYVGIERGDGEAEVDYVAEKILGLRIFANDSGRMDLSVRDTGGEILSVSQFTLASRIRKGRRPDFGNAAEPDIAASLYRHFNQRLQEAGVPVATGSFGAFMEVDSVNDGPVTFVIDRPSGGVAHADPGP